MSILLEIATFALGSGTTAIVPKLVKRRRKYDDGTVPWLCQPYKCYDGWGGVRSYYGFRCPKCQNISSNQTTSSYCDCPDYVDGHFHFTCKNCAYEAIMRTYQPPVWQFWKKP